MSGYRIEEGTLVVFGEDAKKMIAEFRKFMRKEDQNCDSWDIRSGTMRCTEKDCSGCSDFENGSCRNAILEVNKDYNIISCEESFLYDHDYKGHCYITEKHNFLVQSVGTFEDWKLQLEDKMGIKNYAFVQRVDEDCFDAAYYSMVKDGKRILDSVNRREENLFDKCKAAGGLSAVHALALLIAGLEGSPDCLDILYDYYYSNTDDPATE